MVQSATTSMLQYGFVHSTVCRIAEIYLHYRVRSWLYDSLMVVGVLGKSILTRWAQIRPDRYCSIRPIPRNNTSVQGQVCPVF